MAWNMLIPKKMLSSLSNFSCVIDDRNNPSPELRQCWLLPPALSCLGYNTPGRPARQALSGGQLCSWGQMQSLPLRTAGAGSQWKATLKLPLGQTGTAILALCFQHARGDHRFPVPDTLGGLFHWVPNTWKPICHHSQFSHKNIEVPGSLLALGGYTGF